MKEIILKKGEHINFVVTELYDEDMNQLEVARHPDSIYYLKVDIPIEIPEYSMLRIIERKKGE